MSMYKTIFWSDEYADLSTDQSIQLTNGDALVFGQSAFATLDEAVAAANGSNAIVIKVASGKYDSFTVINEGVTMTDVNVVAVDFNGGEIMVDGENITVADSGLTAEAQASILADLNDSNAGSGKIFVAADVAPETATTLYVGMGEANYVVGQNAAAVYGENAEEVYTVLNNMANVAMLDATAVNVEAGKTQTVSFTSTPHYIYGTVAAGGTLKSVAVPNRGDSIVLASGLFDIGSADSDEKAVVDFQTDRVLSVKVSFGGPNGVFNVNNAEIKIGDLWLQQAQKNTFINTTLDIDGVLVAQSSKTTITDSTVTVSGHRKNSAVNSTENILDKLTLTNSTISVNDGVDGTVSEKVTIKAVTMTGSTVSTEGAVVVDGALKLDSNSSLVADSLTFGNSGKIELTLLDGYEGGKIIDITGENGLTDDILSKITFNSTEYGAYIQDGDIFVAKNLTIDGGNAENTEIKEDLVGNQVTIENSKNLSVTGSVKGVNVEISNADDAVLNGGSDNAAAKIKADEKISFVNNGHAVVELSAKEIEIQNNSVNTITNSTIGYEDDAVVAETVSVTAAENADGVISNSDIGAKISVTIADQSVTGTDFETPTLNISGKSDFGADNTFTEKSNIFLGTKENSVNATFDMSNTDKVGNVVAANGTVTLTGQMDETTAQGPQLDIGGFIPAGVGAKDVAIGSTTVNIAENAYVKTHQVYIGENEAVNDHTLNVYGKLDTTAAVFNKAKGELNVYGEMNIADQKYLQAAGDVTVSGANAELNVGGTDTYGIKIGTDEAGLRSKFTIENGASVNVDTLVEVGYSTTRNGDLVINGGNLSTDKMVIQSGSSFNVSGDSSLNIGSLTGSAVQVTADATLTDSKVGGNVSVGFDAENAADTTLTLTGNTSIGTLYVGNEGRENQYTAKIEGADTEVTMGSLYNRTGSKLEITDGAHLAVSNYWQSKGDVVIDGASAELTGVNMYVYNNDTTDAATITLRNGASLSTNADYAIYLGNSEGGPAKGNASMTLESGSSLNVKNLTLHADGEVEEVAGAKASTSVSVTNSTVNVTGLLTNNGTFTVAGESELNIAAATGKAVDFADGAVITSTTGANFSDATHYIGGVTFGSGKFNFAGAAYVSGGDLTLTAGAEVAAATTFAFYNNATIADGASVSGNSVYVNGGDITLNGNLTAKGDDGGLLLRNSGKSFNVDGGNVDVAYIEGTRGTVAVNLTNATVKGGHHITDNGGTLNWNIDNSSVSARTWTNTGAINVNKGEITVTDTLTNSGTITISGESTVKINDLSGQVYLADGTVLKAGSHIDSKVIPANSSTIKALGSVTLNDGFTGGHLYALKTAPASGPGGVGGTITINGTATFDYGFTVSNNYTINGGKIVINATNESGNYGFVLGEATIVLNAEVDIDGNGRAFSVQMQKADITINNSFSHQNHSEAIYISGSDVTVSASGSVDGYIIMADKYERDAILRVEGGSISGRGIWAKAGTDVIVNDGSIRVQKIDAVSGSSFTLTVTDEKLASLGGETYYMIEQTNTKAAALDLGITYNGNVYNIGDSITVGDVIYNVVAGDGNDIAIQAAAKILTVNSSYTEDTPGFGFSKFNKFEDALQAASSEATAIKLESDVTVASGIGYYNLPADLSIIADEHVTLDMAGNSFSPMGKKTLVVGENVEIANMGQMIAYESKVILNGDFAGAHLWTFGWNGDAENGVTGLTINETSKVKVSEQLEFRGGDVTINGNITDTAAAFGDADQIQLLGTTYGAWGGSSGYATKVNLNDTYIKLAQNTIGGAAYKFQDGSSAIVTMDNSIYETAVEGAFNVASTGLVKAENGSIIYINSGVRASNAGTINITDSTFESNSTFTNSGEVNVTDSVFKAAKFDNDAIFLVSGESTVKVDKFTSTSGKAVTLGGAEDRSELTIGSVSGNGAAINVDRLNIYKSDVTLTDNVTVGAPTGAGETYGLHKIQDSTIDLNDKTMTYKGFTVLDSYEGVSQLGSNQGVTIKNGEFNVTDSGHLCFQGYDHVIAEDAVVNFDGSNYKVFVKYDEQGKPEYNTSTMVNVYGSLTVKGKLNVTHNTETNHGYDNVGTTNTGWGKEKYPESVLTVSGVNAEYIIENGHMFNVIHETDSTGAGTMNIVNGATFSFTGADGRSDVGLFFNSNIVNVDAQSSFTVGNYRGYDQSNTVKGSFNSANAGEMVVLGEVNVLYNLATADLILKAGAALTVGSITVDSLTLALGSELTLGSGNSTITADYITVTGKLVPENAEFTLVASGWTDTLAGKQVWFDANYDGTIAEDEKFTVSTTVDNLSGLNFVSIGGNLYVKDFGAATTGIYIGDLSGAVDGKITTPDGATYTVNKDAFASASDAVSKLGSSVSSVTSIALKSGDDVNAAIAAIPTAKVVTIEDYAVINVNEGDLVIQNDGHLDASITAKNTMEITNTSINTLLGSYSSDVEITVNNAGGMIGEGTYGVEDATAFNTGYLTVNDGDAVNVEVNAGTLELFDTNTFGINADSGIFAGDKYGAGKIFLNGSANMSIDGDITDTDVNIDSDLADHTGTVTLNGNQTFSGDISANKIVVADGKEVTFNLNTVDFNELNIAGSLNADFTTMGSFSDAGALTGAGTLNTTHTGAWIVNDSVTRDVTGFAGTVTMENADAEIVLKNDKSYFSDDAKMVINAGQTVTLAKDAAETGIDFSGNGTINVGEYADDAFAEEAEDFSQTLSGDNTDFTGTINVSEGAKLTVENALGATSINLNYESIQSATDVADEYDTQLILNKEGLDIAATVKGDANDIIDVAEDATLSKDAALNEFTGKVEIADNKALTLNGQNTTSAEFTGSSTAELNVNANTTLTAANTNFDGTLNINTAYVQVQLDQDFGKENGNSVIAFNANNTELRIWDEKTVVINSKLESGENVTGENIYNWYSDLTLSAEGALDDYDGEVKIAASANYPGKVTLKGDNVTDAYFTTVNYTTAAEVALDGGDLTLTNADALKEYTGKVNVGKDTLTIDASGESRTTALFHGDAEAVININSNTRLFGTTSGQVPADHYSGQDAITNFNGTINIADGKELALQGNNTTNATVTGTAGSKLTIANASNNGAAVTNTFNSEDAISNFDGTIALGKNKLVLNADNTTEATITGNSSSTITAGTGSKQEFTGNTSSFRGLFDIASGAEVELSGTIADTINAQGDTLTLSNQNGIDVTVNAGTGSDLDNLAFGANNITLGAGDGDDFTNVTGSGSILDFGQDQTFGTVSASDINVTGSEDALTIETLTADINITVDAAQTDAKSDVTVSGNFTGSINVTVDDGNDLAGGYKLVTNSAFDSNSTIDLTVGGTFTDDFKVDELVVIDGKAYLLQLKDNTLILTQMAGYSNFVAVDGDWSSKVPYQSVMDGNSERIIGYDAAYNLDKAVEWIRGYDKGVNPNAGTNPGDATIELTEGKYTLTTGTLMTDANGVTQLILKGRDGQTATITGVIAGSDGSKATTLTLENVRIQGELYGGRNLVIDNANDLRSTGNVLAGGVLNADMANDSSLTINGGYFGHRIMVGGSVNDSASGNTITVTGNTLVDIDNKYADKMVISSNIYGGSWAATGNVVQTGHAEIRINVEKATQIRGNIFVSGGASIGNTCTMNGNSTITFSGNADLLTFTGSVTGNLNDPNNATVEKLVFSDFDGAFNGFISGFDTITISGDTSLELGRRQTQTANTGLTFDITGRDGRFSSVANSAMYTVRDTNNWEFSSNIVVNAAVNPYDGKDYVLVGNYAGDFNDFTYTVAGNDNYTIGEWTYDTNGAAYKLYVNDSNQLVLDYVSAANNVIVSSDNDNLEIEDAKLLTVADGVSAKTTDALNLTDVNLGEGASLEITSKNRNMSNVTLGNNSTLTLDIDDSNSGTMDDLNLQVANAGDTATVIWGENGNWDYAAGYTVGEGVTLQAEKTVINGGNTVQIDGTLESDYLYMLDGDMSVTGTVVAKGDALQVKAGSTLNVEGGEIQAQTSINVWQGDAALNVNNGTINLTAGHIHLWDGACTANFTGSTIGYGSDFIVGNSGNGVVMTVDNSTMNQSVSSDTAVATINSGNRMIVRNGSEINLGAAGMAVNGTGLTSDPGAALEVYGSAINGNIAGNTANDAIAMDVDSILNGSVTGVESLDITGISGLTTDTNGVKAIAGNVDSILANATIESQSANTNGIFQLAGADNTIGTSDDIWAGLGTDASGDTIVAWGTSESFVSETLAAFETKELAIGDTFTSSVADSSTIGDDTNKKSNTHGTLA